MTMLGQMLSPADGSQVFQLVVAWIAIDVMNVHRRRNFAVGRHPNRSVEQLAFSILVVAGAVPPPANPAPFNRMSHVAIIAPCRRLANGIKPWPRTKTG
jgi:hypothetical protein